LGSFSSDIDILHRHDRDAKLERTEDDVYEENTYCAQKMMNAMKNATTPKPNVFPAVGNLGTPCLRF
jgi:glutamine synthetase adenylyltransferase